MLEAAVIGVADERWGEVGHAVIRLRPGATCEAEALRAFARLRLAAYKVPKHVTIVEDYPRTAAGKVQKHLLRQALRRARVTCPDRRLLALQLALAGCAREL